MKTITPLENTSPPNSNEEEQKNSNPTNDDPEAVQILNSFDANIQTNHFDSSPRADYSIADNSNNSNVSSIYILVVIIAVILLLIGGIELVHSLNMSTVSPSGGQNPAAQFSKYLGLVFSGTYILCAIGLILKNDTARSITVILILLNMLTSIGTLVLVIFSPLPLISFCIQFVLLLFLNSQKVKDIF